MKLITVVAPVYNEAEVLDYFCPRLFAALEKSQDYKFEVIFVNDGSIDSSKEKICKYINQISIKNIEIILVNFSRNFGHQSAILCGLKLSSGEAVITIDSDLQDPPEIIAELIERWSKESFEIVNAKRKTRKDSIFKRLTAASFYKILKKISDTPLEADVGDFRLISRRALNELLKLGEVSPYLRGQVSWIGFKTCSIDFNRDKRYAGKTKYSLIKMLRLAIDGLVDFSSAPMRIPFYLGLFSFFISVLLAIGQLIAKILAPSASVPGYTSIVILIFITFSLQMLSIGIISQYIMKILLQVQNRPNYVIENVVHKDNQGLRQIKSGGEMSNGE